MTVGQLIEQLQRYNPNLEVKLEQDTGHGTLSSSLEGIGFTYTVGEDIPSRAVELVLQDEAEEVECSAPYCSLSADHFGDCTIVEGLYR